MKYHYQFVSQTTVRIELIAEDQKEAILLDSLAAAEETNPALNVLFQYGLSVYSKGAIMKKIKFMNFPKVALCSYVPVAQATSTFIQEEKATLF